VLAVGVLDALALLDALPLLFGVFGWVDDLILLPEAGEVRGLPGNEADLGVEGTDILATADAIEVSQCCLVWIIARRDGDTR